MESAMLSRLRDRALEELGAQDVEGHKAARLRYRHIQALKEGRWTEVIEELDRKAQWTVRTLWPLAAFLVVTTAGYAFYAGSGTALSGPEPFLDLLLPGLWLAYGLYAVPATAKWLQHLERARVALEMTREEEQVQAEKQAQATAQYEA